MRRPNSYNFKARLSQFGFAMAFLPPVSAMILLAGPFGAMLANYPDPMGVGLILGMIGAIPYAVMHTLVSAVFTFAD